VIVELLGKAFGAAGQTLVSDFYPVYDQFHASQQKCLTHLLRELRDTITKRPELADHAFFTRCKPEVDGTNNAAERALRPAVVMRKITGGSRSPEGAAAWAVLASVMRTAEQQGRDVLETIKTLLRAEWDGKDIAVLTDTS